MKPLSLAGLLGLASLGAQAQAPAFATPPVPRPRRRHRHAQPAPATPDAARRHRHHARGAGRVAGNLSLAEVLQRRAGVEFRATGGPGQPTGLFIRGAGTAQTLVLVDGVRVGSATIGTTSIENIPLEMIERIEVVKGPLSSLYGSDAIGGVVQIFTRGKNVPHFFATAAYGDGQRPARLGGRRPAPTRTTSFSLAAGARKVDAPSATNSAQLLPRPRPRPLRELVLRGEGRAPPVAGRDDLDLAHS